MHRILVPVCLAVGLLPTAALSHAAEQGFVLLLPTDVYITAGVSAFVLTVILVALMPGRFSQRLFTPLALPQLPLPGWLPRVTSLLSTLVFLALAAIGLAGPYDPLSNLLPLMIWTVFWIGVLGLHALVGCFWRWIDPWAGLCALLFPAGAPPLRLPGRVGVWPAVLLFGLFVSFSIADPVPMDPERLAVLALGYWAFTFAGMALFGEARWRASFEFFSVLFDMLSQISPLRLGPGAGLGVPGWAAVRNPGVSVSLAMFCLVLLGSGSFDGLNETFWWLVRIGVNPLDFPGRSTILWETVAGFIGTNLALIAVFCVCVVLGCRLAGAGGPPVGLAFRRLALSTLPIALGFHIAHYLTTAMIDGQYVLAALTDPFATGADYLGFGEIRVVVGFLRDAEIVRVIWLAQATVIVLAHVIAVLIANAIARDMFTTPGQARLAELPLSLFMVGYTLFGLWLLAAARGA